MAAYYRGSGREKNLAKGGHLVEMQGVFFTYCVYGDLRASDIRSTDSRFLSYECGAKDIWINGTADDSEDLKDNL